MLRVLHSQLRVPVQTRKALELEQDTSTELVAVPCPRERGRHRASHAAATVRRVSEDGRSVTWSA
ncbi:hypothetical protein C1N91_13725 [Curtobacterium sp. SGAir0471]|nr:hypothetical protein C1N91_13725 [Curtobacterium sp. SGAir0471]